ncbi:chloride channel [Blastocladiella britannica]|nr:chloride channel [Blastocladiella britannica]
MRRTSRSPRRDDSNAHLPPPPLVSPTSRPPLPWPLFSPSLSPSDDQSLPGPGPVSASLSPPLAGSDAPLLTPVDPALLRDELNDTPQPLLSMSTRLLKAHTPAATVNVGDSEGSESGEEDDEDPNSGGPTGRRVKYDDFTTIDWIHDSAVERARLRRLRARGASSPLALAWDASQAWVLVALVGIASGVIATFIALAEEWLGDHKSGYCADLWYLNRKFCCWMQDEESCSGWVSWSDSDTGGGWWTGYAVYVAMVVLFTFLSASLCARLAPYAAGSGIPEVKTILGGFIMRKFLGAWTLLIKIVGLPLATAAGLAIGKEGPFVHVSCAVGNILPRMFAKFRNNEAKKREILSAAAAAGIASAFGSPIGGVLFSLEEVSYYFPFKTMLRSFFAAMCAAVTLQVLNPYRTGKLVLFQVTYTTSWHAFELIPFVFIGVLGGLVGALFIRANLRVIAVRKWTWLRRHPVQEACVLALATGIVAYMNPYLRESADAVIGGLFRDCPAIASLATGGGILGTAGTGGMQWDTESPIVRHLCDRSAYTATAMTLAAAAVVKLALMVVTFGIRVPCGCFVPMMIIGAYCGRIVGMGVDAAQRTWPEASIFAACAGQGETGCVGVGPYALLGAAAFLTGITRMTVSLVVIMFEITGALSYVLPIMIAVMTSKFTADFVGGNESIYDALIRLNEYPFLCPKEEYSAGAPAGAVMTGAGDLVVFPAAGKTIVDVERILDESNVKGFPVVEREDNLQVLGYVSRSEVRYALEQARRRPDITDASQCIFTHDTALLHAAGIPIATGTIPTSHTTHGWTSGSTNNPLRSPAPSMSAGALGPFASFGSASTAGLTPYMRTAAGMPVLVDMVPWIDATPVNLVPRTPMEVVVELFKKVGLRYVLVTRNGELLGLITKKDVLRHLGRVSTHSVVDHDWLINRLVG